jgi:hypothetical protein
MPLTGFRDCDSLGPTVYGLALSKPCSTLTAYEQIGFIKITLGKGHLIDETHKLNASVLII